MARIVLKNPNQPSLKKTHTPVSLRYKRYLKLSIFLNFWLIKLIIYILNKPFFDAQIIKLLTNFKQYF